MQTQHYGGYAPPPNTPPPPYQPPGYPPPSYPSPDQQQHAYNQPQFSPGQPNYLVSPPYAASLPSATQAGVSPSSHSQQPAYPPVSAAGYTPPP